MKQKEIILKPGESAVIEIALPEGTKPEDIENIVLEFKVMMPLKLKLLLMACAFMICLFVYYIARNMGRLSNFI
jgi:hypothetical protein